MGADNRDQPNGRNAVSCSRFRHLQLEFEVAGFAPVVRGDRGAGSCWSRSTSDAAGGYQETVTVSGASRDRPRTPRSARGSTADERGADVAIDLRIDTILPGMVWLARTRAG
jgi:hypothetical protein